VNEARFVVRDVFDLAGREGLIAPGQLQSGTIEVGDSLREVESGRSTSVVGIEFHSSPSLGDGSCTLVLERTDSFEIHPGSVLEGMSESS
jgi:sulfate adenylyltransferase subunit 1 (EFTu-like GTPase family)